ncbi:hypothetical protein BG015_005175 [Linnemannia schmuckeri]|uniref:Uncharacterized protein n=1 Tax=Linnemannia schmuckeri TaxID=64567 RepID=A0A9P5S6U6_9FUNG|nr:hypothetical protein BG015_005175 [Linnemannia schmuckeri]
METFSITFQYATSPLMRIAARQHSELIMFDEGCCLEDGIVKRNRELQAAFSIPPQADLLQGLITKPVPNDELPESLQNKPCLKCRDELFRASSKLAVRPSRGSYLEVIRASKTDGSRKFADEAFEELATYDNIKEMVRYWPSDLTMDGKINLAKETLPAFISSKGFDRPDKRRYGRRQAQESYMDKAAAYVENPFEWLNTIPEA